MESPAPQQPAPPKAAPRVRAYAWIRLGATIVGAAVAVYLATSVTLPDVPLCGFKLWTGHPCPGCGMTRSVLNLARGDLWSSLRMHPLGIAIAAAGLSLGVGAVVGLVRGHDPVWHHYSRRGHVLMATLVTVLVGIWIVRVFLVPEWSPDPIRPGGVAWDALTRPG